MLCEILIFSDAWPLTLDFALAYARTLAACTFPALDPLYSYIVSYSVGVSSHRKSIALKFEHLFAPESKD